MRAIAALLLLAAFPAVAETTDRARALSDAVALIDARKYDEAIAALQKLAADDPNDAVAAYELGLAYAAKGDVAACRQTLEPLAAKSGQVQVPALAVLGNCLDGLGEREKAIEVYRRGLKIAPDDSQLNYNLAVTLVRVDRFPEAREVLKHNAERNPWHASSHAALAQVFDAEGFRVPALFAYLRFLALESSTPRAAQAAARVATLLGAGIEKTKEGANININPNPRTEEGDYKAMEMGLAFSGAAMLIEEKKKLTEFERLRDALVSVVAIFTERPAQNDFTGRIQWPFFAKIVKEKLTPAYAALAISRLNVPGAEEWTKQNAAEIARYRAWIAPQTARPAVALPR